jgi:superfamily II DNA or RNA helicase
MDCVKGYIYVRTHPGYDIEGVCKLGKASNIPERDSVYATSELRRGFFEVVFEVSNKNMGNIEILLQKEFYKLNIKFDGGKEFYDKKIISLIEPCLLKNKIPYKKLKVSEIDSLIRGVRERTQVITNLTEPEVSDIYTTPTKFEPRSYQIDIIDNAINHFEHHEKGMLVLICGVGKTLISLWITQKLNCNTVIIGVPNKLLLGQWRETICELFHNVPCLSVSSGISIEKIQSFLKINKEKCIVLTTYASAHKVYTSTQCLEFSFDMKINDECHHLTSINMEMSHNTKKYVQMLNISSKKHISLTATLKLLEGSVGGEVVSNGDVEHFGEIIDKRCLLWAINENIVCDYEVQTIITDDSHDDAFENFSIKDENDQRLFLGAFACLKSMSEGYSHHALIYSNSKENSCKLVQFIKMMLDKKYIDIEGIYYSSYHSEMKKDEQTEILEKFGKSKFGIITCVYCLGEGWDFPLLDCVVFSENMTSIIRIVQAGLRASRKDKNDKNKKTRIILPILNRNDWLEDKENPDMKKVREVIYQLGLEDETIAQKIKVYKIIIEPQKPYKKDRDANKIVEELGEYDEEATKALRLKTTKRTSLGITYEKAKKILIDKNINSKEQYYELCKIDNRLSEEPDILFKGQFTNWIEYLSIQRIYYDFGTCKNKVDAYLLLYPEMKKHYLDLSVVSNELTKIDSLFPPNGLWVEYYNIKDLRDIITITNKKKKTGAIL